MKTLKYEEVYLWDYRTMEDVFERIPFFLEDVYNRKWLHSSLGYQSPNKFEMKLTGERSAGNPHTAFDEAGAGNRKITAPVFDPTGEGRGNTSPTPYIPMDTSYEH